MIKLSKQTDYALEMLVYLARSHKKTPVSLHDISRDCNISFLFLQKIARALRGRGLIEATMGASGGYRIAKPAQQISLYDVIEATDGSIGLTECTRTTGHCAKVGHCAIEKTMRRTNEVLMRQFRSTNIADMT